MEDNITLKNGLNGNNIVQKSTPLQSLWKSSLGLGEFKVLDTYLSRIDSHHPERRTVKFSKEEFERLLGITEVKPAALKKYTDHLCQQIVELETPKRNKEIKNIFHSKGDFSYAGSSWYDRNPRPCRRN